jgi:hypothetical protein
MTATHRTAEEAKAEHIRLMGDGLGTVYAALWQEVAWVYGKWSDFVTVFGTKGIESRSPEFRCARVLQTDTRLDLGECASAYCSANGPASHSQKAKPHDPALSGVD